MIDEKRNIDLLNVADLDGEHFYVPSYQRGYRWTKRQVVDLLNDILQFRKGAGGSSYYCLQPLVLKPLSKHEANEYGLENKRSWYEVIDGQQRLTTIKILVSYLKTVNPSLCLPDWEIKYETRKETGEFLDDMIGLGTSGVKKYLNVCQDVFYIKKAYLAIEDWFAAKPSAIKDFAQALNEKGGEAEVDFEGSGLTAVNAAGKTPDKPVKFIVYLDTETVNPIDIFERINIGKIKLTNAELIRALFLLKSNYKEPTPEAKLLKQQQIANEWDAIEHSLQNPDVWGFLTDQDDYKSSRIGFLFDLIFRHAENRMPNNTDDYETFRYFNNKIQEGVYVVDLWNEAKNLYDDLMDWYSNKTIYHYVGWLTKKEKSKVVYTLYSEYSEDKTTDDFIEFLKRKIKDDLGVSCVVTKDATTGKPVDVEFKDSNSNEFNYHSRKEDLRLFYLLLNVQLTVNSLEDSRFRFDLYEEEKWNIEHIDSYTENSFANQTVRDTWLNAALACLNRKQRQEYDKWLSPSKTFSQNREKILDLIGEDHNPASVDEKNSVGNLTLLDEHTNKSYGNQIFLMKRNIILKKDKKGEFVLLATKNAFLKYFSKSPTSLKWSLEDIKDYRLYIYEILKGFIKEL